MSEILLREILAAQADDLAKGGKTKPKEEYLQLFPAQAEELAPLLDIAERTSRLLSVRVEPDAAFREDLHRSLLAMARQQQARGQPDPLWMNIPRGWLIGAAAVGSAVSVASLVAYLFRQRQLPTLFR